jgi:hypothetical protein
MQLFIKRPFLSKIFAADLNKHRASRRSFIQISQEDWTIYLVLEKSLKNQNYAVCKKNLNLGVS